MSFIDQTYLEDSIGTAHLSALTGGDNDRQTRLIAQASALVDAALTGGGYSRRAATSTINDTPEVVKLATVGQFLLLAYGSHYGELPPTYANAVNIIEHIRKGIVEVDGETQSTTRAPGGVVGSDITSTVADGGRPAVFTRKKLSSW